jgi:ParB family transcriptional regulator, chromosome partitioning protein
MDLEHHQIELRYEALRRRDPILERQILASLASVGQACPVVVLASEGTPPFILLDGYKRLRALKRLKRDMVRAVLWDMGEAEALVQERLMRASGSGSPLEEGWFLRELRDRFGMSLAELGERLGRTPSWVSRRLGLVRDLPEAVQDAVRRGRIAPHTAMRVILPLARANRGDALAFLEVLLRASCSTREAEILQEGWLRGNDQVRERIQADPKLFLGARSDAGALKGDLGTLSTVARRALGRAGEEAVALVPPRTFRQARSDCEALFTRLGKEFAHA